MLIKFLGMHLLQIASGNVNMPILGGLHLQWIWGLQYRLKDGVLPLASNYYP